MVIIDEHTDDANEAGVGDGDTPQNPGPNAPSPAGGANITAQLAQARELEAKLAEECCQVRLLRTTIAGEASARGKCARELGSQARKRINTDFNVNDQHTLPRAS
jgi:hypothetical protein